MIYLLFKSYLTILVSIGIGSLCMFTLGLYFIIRTHTSSTDQSEPQVVASFPEDGDEVHDVTAIAGDDVIATQLDLAHAYIETGKTQLAQKILNYVVEQGNAAQREEAQHLLSST